MLWSRELHCSDGPPGRRVLPWLPHLIGIVQEGGGGRCKEVGQRSAEVIASTCPHLVRPTLSGGPVRLCCGTAAPDGYNWPWSNPSLVKRPALDTR